MVLFTYIVKWWPQLSHLTSILSYRYMKKKRKKILLAWELLGLLSQQLSNMLCSSINKSHHVVHHIPSTYLITGILYIWPPSSRFLSLSPSFGNHKPDLFFSYEFFVAVVVCFIASVYTNEVIQYLSFSVWLISPIIMPSRSIHHRCCHKR